MKIIEKPYSGEPNVRFDEGELEIEQTCHYASSLLYPSSWAVLGQGPIDS